MQRYHGDFTCKADVEREFDVTLSADAEILWAQYDQEGYEGAAWVLYRQAGKLFEVYAWHCSCNGLEEQWEPEETTPEALDFTAQHGLRLEPMAALGLERVLGALKP